uniref:Putative LOV domain-containing protein n=1 Tax=Dunaliella salina TaxID=3046 RepID=A0A126WZS7_DUNSA|nr:putative LOV domain-containing protein [Dunaliella salina]
MKAHDRGGGQADAHSSAEGHEGDKEEHGSKPWHSPQRPLRAEPPQDNSFCLEDEPHALLVETYLQSLSISEPFQTGNPLVYVSPGFESMSGYTAGEVLGNNCKMLQGEDTEPERVSDLRAAMDKKAFVSVVITNNRKDGRTFPNLLSILPVVDGCDNLTKFVGIQCDLNERKRWEQVDEAFIARWQEQVEQHLQASMVLETSMLDASNGSTLAAVSTGFCKLTGYSQAEVLGNNCLCLAGPDSSHKAMKKLVQAQAAAKPTAVKLLCYKKDGSPFWGYFFSCPLMPQGRLGSTQQTLCILVDITATRLKRVGKYALGKVIGSGSYGIVRIGKNTASDEIVAVKSVDGSQFRSISEIEQMQEEMNVLSSLKHPNIIRLIEVHFTNNVFFLVMEFASGGSLVKYIYKHEDHRLPESEAQKIFVAMSSALDYCHRRRIVHRDLKPENILMDEKNNIKICDFGLAAVAAPFGSHLTQQCGTPEFAAPEIITGKEYDGPAIDIWSMGVILYEAIAGTLPFKGSSHKDLCKAIQRGVYEPLPSHVSSACKDLIRGMLRVDPAQRMSLEQILRHPWCRDLTGMPVADDELEDPEGINMRKSISSRPSESHHRDTGSIYDSDVPDSPMSHQHHSFDSDGLRDGQETPPQEGVHDSLRLVIDGAQDDPITAAIMRAQRQMQNVSIINDNQRHEIEQGQHTKSQAVGMKGKHSHHQSMGAVTSSGHLRAADGHKTFTAHAPKVSNSGNLLKDGASHGPKASPSGALSKDGAGRCRLDADPPPQPQPIHRPAVSLPGVSLSGHMKYRANPNSSHSGAQGTGHSGHLGIAADRARRGTGELPQIHLRGQQQASNLGKATSLIRREDVDSKGAASSARQARAISLTGDKLPSGPTSSKRR